MKERGQILERWIAETIRIYPGAAAAFLSSEEDAFRNPVGHTLRQSLSSLFEQLQGSMDTSQVVAALDAIIRIRAVQDLTASQAAGFIFLLKPIVRELAPELDQVSLGQRIDQLALLAFDSYMRCREQLAEIRLSESRRSVRLHQAVG